MIYFRCDGNSIIGGGHVMRCLSFANKLKKRGLNTAFITADSEFSGKIKDNGFDVVVLNTKYDCMCSELDNLLNLLKEDDVIVVDSYFVSFDYFDKLRNKLKVVYIDDLCKEAYPVNLLINYNINANQNMYDNLYSQSNIKTPKFYLGTKYAPIRDEFSNLKERKVNESIKNVFVSTGASDSLHIALKLIEEIAINTTNYNYHIVVGEKNKDAESIIQIANDLTNVFTYYKCNKISEIMAKCDVAVSASGSTLYELCSVGIPIISFIMADNQIDGMNEFVKSDLVFYLGDARDKSIDLISIEKAVAELSNFEVREKMIKRIRNVVDGKGADRIADAIGELC